MIADGPILSRRKLTADLYFRLRCSVARRTMIMLAVASIGMAWLHTTGHLDLGLWWCAVPALTTVPYVVLVGIHAGWVRDKLRDGTFEGQAAMEARWAR